MRRTGSREDQPLYLIRELVGVCLRLGVTAFGGPAAHIAMMRDEIVRRRAWLSDRQFLDSVGATQLIPGPNSTELAIHIGYHRAGLPGLLAAGLAFVVPAAAMVGALAWGYERYGRTAQAAWLLYGIGPVVVGIVAVAVWHLGRAAVKDAAGVGLSVGSLVLALLGSDEIALLATGAFVMLFLRSPWRDRGLAAVLLIVTVVAPGAVALSDPATPVTLERLGLFFLKVGSILFGSGYVLFAYLQADLVESWRWLTERELIDAVAAGQLTPGPVLTAATFVGFLVAGWAGAVVATVAIFLPGFVFVVVTHPLVERLRASRLMAALLDGVTLVSLGLMAAVLGPLAAASGVDLATGGIALTTVVALLATRVTTTWLILAGA